MNTTQIRGLYTGRVGPASGLLGERMAEEEAKSTPKTCASLALSVPLCSVSPGGACPRLAAFLRSPTPGWRPGSNKNAIPSPPSRVKAFSWLAHFLSMKSD